MSFNSFISLFKSEKPKSDMELVANEIAADKQFPAVEDLETLLSYAQSRANWRSEEKQNVLRKAYALYASAYGISVEWQNTLDFIESNHPHHFNVLDAKEKEVLLRWISENLEPFRTKGYNSIRNSYRLKHNFEFSEEGFHVTNGQFKGAMLASGFIPKDYQALNWVFTLGKNAGITVM